MDPVHTEPNPVGEHRHVVDLTNEVLEIKEEKLAQDESNPSAYGSYRGYVVDGKLDVSSVSGIQGPDSFLSHLEDKSKWIALAGEGFSKPFFTGNSTITSLPETKAQTEVLIKLLKYAGHSPLIRTGGIAAALALVSATHVTGADAEAIQRGQQMIGCFFEMASAVTNVGSFDTIRQNIQDLQTMDVGALRRSLAKDASPAMDLIGNYFTSPQKTIMTNWMTWPDAYMWTAAGKIVQTFEAAQSLPQSISLFNHIVSCSCMSPFFVPPTDYKIISEQTYGYISAYYKGAITSFQELSSTKIPLGVNGDQYLRDGIASAISGICNGFNPINGSLPPREITAWALMTAVARIAQEYNMTAKY